MSKMFSVVTLASDSGLLEEYYAPGSPDCAEDLLEDEIIRDDLRSLPKSDRVYAEVGTVYKITFGNHFIINADTLPDIN